MGTLAEFTSGWLSGCPYLGVLESSGGITAQLAAIASSVETQWGSVVVRGSDPSALVTDICNRLDSMERDPWEELDHPIVADVLEALREVRLC